MTIEVISGAGSATRKLIYRTQKVINFMSLKNHLLESLDYLPVVAQLVFPVGSGPGTTQSDALNPLDDNGVEGSESVPLDANIIAGMGSFAPNGPGDSATVVILDDDRKCLDLLIPGTATDGIGNARTLIDIPDGLLFHRAYTWASAAYLQCARVWK